MLGLSQDKNGVLVVLLGMHDDVQLPRGADEVFRIVRLVGAYFDASRIDLPMPVEQEQGGGALCMSIGLVSTSAWPRYASFNSLP